MHSSLSTLPAWPLRPEFINETVKALRARGYRSGVNYLMAAKRRHIEIGFEWTATLMQSFSDGVRMSKRRLGPPKRARAFDLPRVAVAHCIGLLVASAMLMPYHVVMASALCMMRIAEISHVSCRDVGLDVQCRSVRISLSASKTDMSGRGFKFRWRCTCGHVLRPNAGTSHQWLLCIFHCFLDVAIQQHGFSIVGCASGTRLVAETETAFFGTRSSSPITTALISAFLERLDSQHSLKCLSCLEDDVGVWSGHSCRRSGAQYWTRTGLDKEIIRKLARWRSDVIESYLSLCALENFGPDHLCRASCPVQFIQLFAELRSILKTHAARPAPICSTPSALEMLLQFH